MQKIKGDRKKTTGVKLDESIQFDGRRTEENGTSPSHNLTTSEGKCDHVHQERGVPFQSTEARKLSLSLSLSDSRPLHS